MNEPTDVVGICPVCETDLPRSAVLIEYETASGAVGRFVDCPTCDDVVKLVEE